MNDEKGYIPQSILNEIIKIYMPVSTNNKILI